MHLLIGKYIDIIQREKDHAYVFFMKIRVDGEEFAHLRIKQPTPPLPHWRAPELLAIEYAKKSNDTLEYFEKNQFTLLQRKM